MGNIMCQEHGCYFLKNEGDTDTNVYIISPRTFSTMTLLIPPVLFYDVLQFEPTVANS